MPKQTPIYGQPYYSVTENRVYPHIWHGDFFDRMFLETNNCFITQEAARKVANRCPTPEEYFDPKRDYADNAFGKSCLERCRPEVYSASKVHKYYFRKRQRSKRSNYTN